MLELGFSMEVVLDMYFKDDFKASLFQQIFDFSVEDNLCYKYSDFGFYLIVEMVDCFIGMFLDEFMCCLFYKFMGLEIVIYCLLECFEFMDIVFIEIDNYFCK